MKNLKSHTEQLKAIRNPGYAIGEFLIEHSLSLEYLESQLEGYLEAIRADKAEARKFAAGFLKRPKPTASDTQETP